MVSPGASRWPPQIVIRYPASVPEFLYIFGYETPRQRRNNAAHGWHDEDSRGVLIDASDAGAALCWGDHIAEKYVSQLHGLPELDWGIEGYASFIENDRAQLMAHHWPRVKVGQYPDLDAWLERDRV